MVDQIQGDESVEEDVVDYYARCLDGLEVRAAAMEEYLQQFSFDALKGHADTNQAQAERLDQLSTAIRDLRERFCEIEESVHEVQRMHASIMETLKASAQRIQGVEQGQVLLQAGQQQRRAKGIRITWE